MAFIWEQLVMEHVCKFVLNKQKYVDGKYVVAHNTAIISKQVNRAKFSCPILF